MHKIDCYRRVINYANAVRLTDSLQNRFNDIIATYVKKGDLIEKDDFLYFKRQHIALRRRMKCIEIDKISKEEIVLFILYSLKTDYFMLEENVIKITAKKIGIKTISANIYKRILKILIELADNNIIKSKDKKYSL